ncbi:hypothetical protein ACP8HI_06265 [Paenibacillus sp. FA6]|uniref:hypothetical protein n=1 Tax=Paenibacillus sp. FA6 TaxID=3413029 RepID=UPI003F658F5C
MQEYILSGGEIVRLKQYIEDKHRSLEPKQRAPILADAVHRIIESRLPSFPEAVKKQICYELLMKQRESLVIHTDDVLQHCMSLDLGKEGLLSSLAAWVSSRTAVPVQEEVAQDILLRWSQQLMPGVGVSLQALEREWDQLNPSVYREIAAASESVVPVWNKEWFNRRKSILIACLCAVVLLFILTLPLDLQSSAPALHAEPIDISQPILNENVKKEPVDGIPKEFEYVSIDTKRLQQYLRDKNSMLAEEPYLSAIVKASKEFNIHPLLLFAITGQEQGFVPKDHKRVEEIANNPFNVFGSWESYNTSIEGSATIAARTVFNISGRRPGASDPIQWLNHTYAEDPNWWKGVTWFFDEMKREIADESFE